MSEFNDNGQEFEEPENDNGEGNDNDNDNGNNNEGGNNEQGTSPIEQSLVVVEDGSIVEGANSYIDEEYADLYHAVRGNETWEAATSTQRQTAIIRATQSVDAMFSRYWEGYQVDAEKQELAFPRKGIRNIKDKSIPNALKKTVAEAALRELREPNSLMPDLERGGKIRRVKAGTVEVEYASHADGSTTYTMFNALLKGLISSIPNGNISVHSVML